MSPTLPVSPSLPVAHLAASFGDVTNAYKFYLSKRHTGLQCILLCRLPPFLTEQARAATCPNLSGQLLMERWIPAMNSMCMYTGLSDAQIEILTERALSYITDGRMPLTSAPFQA